MHWQNKGDYLCVKVDRYIKKKKSTYFELFRMREKGVPIEVLELNQNIIAFAWEPAGSRFSIIHSNDTNTRPDISFYSMEGTQVTHYIVAFILRYEDTHSFSLVQALEDLGKEACKPSLLVSSWTPHRSRRTA